MDAGLLIRLQPVDLVVAKSGGGRISRVCSPSLGGTAARAFAIEAHRRAGKRSVPIDGSSIWSKKPVARRCGSSTSS
jgi:hypothetical protein